MKRPAGAHPPAPHFQLCAWYEQVESIMRSDPKRFFLFSLQTKKALSVYLEMRERHWKGRLAA